MKTDTMPQKKGHHGRNVKRLRELLGVRQEDLATELDMTQQNMSLLEQKDEIDDMVLDKIANYLHVSVDVIKNMNDESTINYINTIYDSSVNQGQLENYYGKDCTVNPIEKIVELYNEKIELYERMLKAEQEKNVMLEKMLGEQKK